MLSRKITLLQIRRAAIFLSLLVLSGGAGYYFGLRRQALQPATPRPIIEVVNREVPAEYRSVDFSLFWQVWDELERSYVDPDAIDRERMVYGAISGMTSALGDPYTSFFPPSENRQNKENLSGSFYGVGIQIGYRDRQLAVIAPIKDMPAQRAGIESGDFILRIIDADRGVDQDTQGISLPEAVSLIRGERGTRVTLRLFRDGVDEPFDLSITREEIVIPSVELAFLPSEDGTVAHLGLTQFGERTGEEWDEAVLSILARRNELSGIILDLRGNPGGFFNGAIAIGSEFLDNGTVVVQQGRERSQTFESTGESRLAGIPLVILVDSGSASASEIVAGALRDRLGVTLVGEQTFGKGTVQEAKDLQGGAGLHVTTSHWVLPSGEEISDTGLTPDVVVELVDEEEGEEEVDEQLQKALEIISKI